MARRVLSLITVFAHNDRGETVTLFLGVPQHPTTQALLTTLAQYHACDSVEEMLEDWGMHLDETPSEAAREE